MNSIAGQSAFSAAVPPDLPLWDDRRPAPRYNLPRAWKHFRALIANKEDTAQVFPILESLPWRNLRREFERFAATAHGQALMAREPFLPAILDDHAALRRLPMGSLAHAYCDFMEAEGLTAQGLVDEFDRYAQGFDIQFVDQADWWFNRMRDSHDMLHVLTGFGRDALGEQCVLAFTYSQQPALGHLFIGYAGGLEIRKQSRGKVPILRAIREAQVLGRKCPRIIELSIVDLLPLPLDDVRRRLNITPPRLYHQAHAMWRARGVDPYDLLGRRQAA